MTLKYNKILMQLILKSLLLLILPLSCKWDTLTFGYKLINLDHDKFKKKLKLKQIQLKKNYKGHKDEEKLKRESEKINKFLDAPYVGVDWKELKNNFLEFNDFSFGGNIFKYDKVYDYLIKIKNPNSLSQDYLKKFDKASGGFYREAFLVEYIKVFMYAYKFLETFTYVFRRKNLDYDKLFKLTIKGDSYQNVIKKKENIMEKLLLEFIYIDLTKFDFNGKDWDLDGI